MRLPELVAYQAAVQHPATAFADPDLRSATVTTNRLGLPRAATGNFAVTYQLCHAGRRWAVRCFHRDATDRGRRYAAISQSLAALRGGPFVGISYLPMGVRVNQTWYPVTKMPWLDGRPLNRAVEERLTSPPRLANLERRFVALVGELRRLSIAHGDLQHGNILVDPSGALRLVDYDGMYVPALRGMPASEAGDANYQHPARADEFDAQLDRFAALVIVVALRALASAPHLWQKYNTDDNLLFRRADFVSPRTSELFRDLANQPATRELAERLSAVCANPYPSVPLLEDFLGPHGAAPASIPAATIRPGDITTLNRLYGRPRRPTARRTWSVRRAVAQLALAFTPDGCRMVTADRSGMVRLRDAASGRVERAWRLPAPATALACSVDGRRVAAAADDGGLHIWNLNSPGGNAGSVTPSGANEDRWASQGAIRAMVWAPARLLLASAAGSAVKLYELPDGRQFTLTISRGRIACVAFSSDGRQLAVATTRGMLHCWSVPGRHWLPELRLPVAEPMLRLAFAPDGSRLVAAFRDTQLLVWELATGTVTHTLRAPAGVVSDLALSPHGQCVAVSTLAGSVSLRALGSAKRGRGPKVTRPPINQLLDIPHLFVYSANQVIDVWRRTLRVPPPNPNMTGGAP